MRCDCYCFKGYKRKGTTRSGHNDENGDEKRHERTQPMIDLLSFLSNTLARQQQQKQFADENALREKLAGDQLAFNREQLAQSGNQFGQDLGLRTRQVGNQENQFGQDLGLRTRQFDANNALAQNEFLANLGKTFQNNDVLRLLGDKLGVNTLRVPQANPFGAPRAGGGNPTGGRGDALTLRAANSSGIDPLFGYGNEYINPARVRSWFPG